MDAPTHVVVGTYEELILGYKLNRNEKNEWNLKQCFTDHSHTGCVKSLSLSDTKILASGSSDETIRLFNLQANVEMGSLMQHDGTVTSLGFFGDNHLFSSSEDGSICIWKTNGWECLRTLKGHKGAVHSVSVHPSGKLALSIGKDKTLRTWNLMTGKTAFIKNIKENLVLWSPDGNTYIVATSHKLDVYDLEIASVKHTVTMDSRVCAVIFVTDKALCVSTDNGNIYIIDVQNNKMLHTFEGHITRVKALSSCYHGDDCLLVGATSDGLVKVWSLDIKQEGTTERLLTKADTKFRLTCLVTKATTKSVKRTEGDASTEKTEDRKTVEIKLTDKSALGKKQKRKEKTSSGEVTVVRKKKTKTGKVTD